MSSGLFSFVSSTQQLKTDLKDTVNQNRFLKMNLKTGGLLEKFYYMQQSSK